MSFRTEIFEAQDLSKYANDMKKLTANNDNMAARMLMAKLIGDKKLIQKVQAINAIVDAERSMPHEINDYNRKVYTQMQEMGRRKFGKDNWNKNIYSNN